MENNSLLSKLNDLVARFQEVSTLITDPSVVADMKRYDEFYKRLVNSVPGLSDVTSSFAMEQIKYTTSLPIE